MRYQGRVDGFTLASMLVGIAAPAFIAVTLNSPWVSVGSLLAAGLFFGISYPQRYETRPDALLIRAGLTTRLIAYTRIKSVQPAADGRISIDYGIGNVLIAPREAQEFLADVAARIAPQSY